MEKKTGYFAAIWLLSGVVLAACGNGYQAGYAQGCMSGYVDANKADMYAKDEERFRTDAVYRKGWQTGYDKCYEEGSRYMMGGPGPGG